MKFNARQHALTLALLCLLLVPPHAARAQKSNDRAGRLERAASLISSDQLAEAERELNQVLKVRPEEAAALNLLGAVRAKQGKLDEAEALFTRAVRSNKALQGRGRCLALPCS